MVNVRPWVEHDFFVVASSYLLSTNGDAKLIQVE